MSSERSPYRLMMDHFERRKSHFKTTVNEMIDDFFEEMLNDCKAICGMVDGEAAAGSGQFLEQTSRTATSAIPNFAHRLPPKKLMLFNGFKSSLSADRLADGPASTLSANLANNQEATRSNGDSQSFDSFGATQSINLEEPEVKLEVDESPSEEGFPPEHSSGQQQQQLPAAPEARSYLNLRKRKAPEPQVADESSQDDRWPDGVATHNDGKYVGTLALKCWISDCGQLLEGKNKLDIHFRTEHQTVKPYHCIAKSCSAEFKDRPARGAHFRTAHSPTEPLDCYHCHRTFKNPTSLTTHVNLLHEEGLFNCTAEGCTYVGPLRDLVRKHIRLAHPRFVCPIVGCGKSFNLKIHLEAHQRKAHNATTGTRPFRCIFTGCSGYAATRKGQVVQHVRVAHLGLPLSVKLQRQLGLEDTGDPYDYIEVVEDGGSET